MGFLQYYRLVEVNIFYLFIAFYNLLKILKEGN
jgi:hypothetical protein